VDGAAAEVGRQLGNEGDHRVGPSSAALEHPHAAEGLSRGEDRIRVEARPGRALRALLVPLLADLLAHEALQGRPSESRADHHRRKISAVSATAIDLVLDNPSEISLG
jgi:hypothetical protein